MAKRLWWGFYQSSAAPVYPRDLIAIGMEGTVQAIYVVDTTGMVDTTTVEVVRSDDLRFTESSAPRSAGCAFGRPYALARRFASWSSKSSASTSGQHLR